MVELTIGFDFEKKVREMAHLHAPRQRHTHTHMRRDASAAPPIYVWMGGERRRERHAARELATLMHVIVCAHV